MTGHTVAWTLKEYCAIEATFTCHEPEGASCREYCRGSCEDGVIVCDDCVEYGHEKRTDRHCAHCGTPIEPCKCIKIEWMDNDGALDCYAGPTVPLHDGPVEFVWQNGYFDWHYAVSGVPKELLGDTPTNVQSDILHELKRQAWTGQP